MSNGPVRDSAAEPGQAINGSAADALAVNGHRPASADERRGRPQPVTCERCAATVVAVKFSAAHTSVQWDPAAVGRCAEFSVRAAEGERTALIDTCLSLRASIDRAVAEGRLEVAPP
ncbi:MAG TPA: hypothetical protein VGS19_13460 [Streptosporangiaceae bacterium]|nr:hypothetical protein [Streptosporangiaceae bacterium]